MARYIDADKLITFANNHKNKMIDANDIARFSTADVVPKSEVDLLVRDLRFKNIECNQLRERITKAKQEVAREIFAELDTFLVTRVIDHGYVKYDMTNRYKALKKKYTEGNDNG